MDYVTAIRAQYAVMPDEDLLNLKKDSLGLTPEATELLHSELSKRGLVQEDDTLPTDQVNNISFKEKYAAKEFKSLWQSAINLKTDNQTDDEVVTFLLRKGLTADEGLFILKELPQVIREKINDAESDRLGALIRLCCGIAVIIITMLASPGNAMYFIGWMTIAVSVVQTAIAGSKKSRYQAVLNRENEEVPPGDA
jgi:hypothetical protein